MTAGSGPPAAPTNPRWVKITVIALIATVCLSAVDLGIDLSRRRKS